MTRPNLVIAGAPHCGTTTVAACLDEHPEIAMLPEQVEMPFSNPSFARSQRRGSLEAYDEACASVAGRSRYIGVLARHALYRPYVMHNIAEHLPEARLLFVLRNPIDRAYSEYAALPPGKRASTFAEHVSRDEAEVEALRGWAARGKWQRAFREGNDAVGILERGIYAPALRRYRDLFGSGRLLVLSTDELTGDVPAALDRVLEHLGLAKGFTFSRTEEIRNASLKTAPVEPTTRARLADYYAEFNAPLFELLSWPSGIWSSERP